MNVLKRGLCSYGFEAEATVDPARDALAFNYCKDAASAPTEPFLPGGAG